MKSIFKYRLPFKEDSTIDMPDGARIIRIDGIDGAIWVWAIIDTDNPNVVREFKLFKTGSEMPENIYDDYTYLGCGAIFVQMELMMYVFENDSYIPKLSVPIVNDFNWKLVQED